MKTLPAISERKFRAAFTIPELLLALSIFLVVVTALVVLQIVGMKMGAHSTSKMASTVSSLKVLNAVRDKVLGASSVLVGNGSSNSFAATGNIGNALQLYAGTNTNTYVRFFVSTDDQKLYALNVLDSTNNEMTMIAPHITNESIFQTVDFQGNTSTSSREHYSIKMTLQFSQLDYKVPRKTFEYYTLETEMTPRTQ